MLVTVVILIFGLCISIFNYWFQNDRYKRMTEEEIKRFSRFNSPNAWLLYTMIFFVGTLGIISYYIYNLYVAIMKLR